MPRAGHRSVVVGVDFSSGGDKAILEGVRRLAEGRATQLHAVHVFDPNVVPLRCAALALTSEAKFLEQGPLAIFQRVDEIARSEAVLLPADALRVHARLGDTVEVLLQVVAECDAELVVIGSHAQPHPDRLFGPVSELLVRTATCTVLVARPEGHSMLLLKTERSAQPFSLG